MSKQEKEVIVYFEIAVDVSISDFENKDLKDLAIEEAEWQIGVMDSIDILKGLTVVKVIDENGEIYNV